MIFCLVGASGVGKSTILNHLKDVYSLEVTEVSARPFLPADIDYVNSLDEKSQTLITQHRFVSILEGMFMDHPIVYSRSPIDSLAYELALQKAPHLIPLLRHQVEISKHFVIYIYLPVEFEMTATDDIQRGTNRKAQLDTDKAIQQIFEDHKVKFQKLSGTKEERFAILKEIMRSHNIYGNK